MSRANTVQWYAVRTATRQEAKVVASLQERGLEVFMPARARWRQTRSAKVRVEVALFTGYMFILCSPAEFYEIRATEGVHQFVRIMGDDGEFAPMPFPAEAIGDIMLRQDLGEFDETRSKPQRYSPRKGDRVMVTGGKWYGYLAEVLSLAPNKRSAKVRIEGVGGAPTSVGYASMDAA